MAVDTPAKIVVLGAGPIGLETALYGRALGLPVKVYEKGQVGSNLLDWGHIRLFSPWSYNRSPLGTRRLVEEHGHGADVDETYCPTGRELVEHYLEVRREMDRWFKRL